MAVCVCVMGQFLFLYRNGKLLLAETLWEEFYFSNELVSLWCQCGLSVSSCAHLDDVGGLRVGQRPVQEAAAACCFCLTVKGWRRRAGGQTQRAQ